MPPTSKKLRGHIGLGLSVQSVCQSVRPSVCQSVCPQALDDWTLFFFFFFFLAFSPVWRPLRYVHAIILPLKPFLSILNQPSSMGYYIDKVGNAVS